MKNLTLGTTYYNSPDELILFIEKHIDYVDELIIVDDGSKIYPATTVLKPSKKIRLYRVKEDYGFNSHGCRNLIMKETSNDWNILLDVDRTIIDPEECIRYIKTRTLNENTLYRFMAAVEGRVKESIHESVNDYLIHRNHFFSAGGYDEELIGIRDGDRQYFAQLSHFGKEYLLHSVHIRLTRRPSKLTDKNFVITSKNDKTSLDHKILEIVNKRIVKPDPNKPILTFDWEKVF